MSGSDARDFGTFLHGHGSPFGEGRSSQATNVGVVLKSDIERLGAPVIINNEADIFKEINDEMSVPPMTKQERRQSKKQSVPTK